MSPAPRALLLATAALAVSATTFAPGWAQTIGQGRGVEVPWWRVTGALVFCLGLAVAAAFLLKKRLGGGPALFSTATRRLMLVETLRLSHQIDLCVVHFENKEFLIAAGANGATLLSTRETPVAPPAEIVP